jgi:formylmethanofuran dehydrogenase subunit E
MEADDSRRAAFRQHLIVARLGAARITADEIDDGKKAYFRQYHKENREKRVEASRQWRVKRGAVTREEWLNGFAEARQAKAEAKAEARKAKECAKAGKDLKAEKIKITIPESIRRTIICRNCGEPFYIVTGSRKLCSDRCIVERSKNKQKEWRARNA